MQSVKHGCSPPNWPVPGQVESTISMLTPSVSKTNCSISYFRFPAPWLVTSLIHAGGAPLKTYWRILPGSPSQSLLPMHTMSLLPQAEQEIAASQPHDLIQQTIS